MNDQLHTIVEGLKPIEDYQELIDIKSTIKNIKFYRIEEFTDQNQMQKFMPLLEQIYKQGVKPGANFADGEVEQMEDYIGLWFLGKKSEMRKINLIAMDGDKVVGVANMIATEHSHSGNLDVLAVDKDYRGYKLGKSLYNAEKKALKEFTKQNNWTEDPFIGIPVEKRGSILTDDATESIKSNTRADIYDKLGAYESNIPGNQPPVPGTEEEITDFGWRIDLIDNIEITPNRAMRFCEDNAIHSYGLDIEDEEDKKTYDKYIGEVKEKMPSVVTIDKPVKLTYAVVTKENIEQAIKVQNTIFSNSDEDATLNFLSSLDIKQFEDISKLKLIYDKVVYYLVCNGEKPVAISGLYTLKNYLKDAWLGWFGVLPEEQKKGYATQILQEMIRRAKAELGKNYFRLHTSTEDNVNACKLYKKVGFTYEPYTVEDSFDNATYSIATGNETKDLLWGNKLIDIAKEEILLDDTEKQRIITEYTNRGILKSRKLV